MKLYLIRTQDYFQAIGEGTLPIDAHLRHAGSLWIEIWLSDADKQKYPYPIWNP